MPVTDGQTDTGGDISLEENPAERKEMDRQRQEGTGGDRRRQEETGGDINPAPTPSLLKGKRWTERHRRRYQPSSHPITAERKDKDSQTQEETSAQKTT